MGTFAAKTEGNHNDEFLISQAVGMRSFDNAVVASGQGKLKSGTVVSLSASKLVATTSGNTGALAGILRRDVDATSADADAVLLARDAEVDTSLLIVPTDAKAASLTALIAKGIIPR